MREGFQVWSYRDGGEWAVVERVSIDSIGFGGEGYGRCLDSRERVMATAEESGRMYIREVGMDIRLRRSIYRLRNHVAKGLNLFREHCYCPWERI